MSQHEEAFLIQLEKKLNKQYVKYAVSGIVFVIIFFFSTYVSIRLAVQQNDFKHSQFDRDISNNTLRIEKIETRVGTIEIKIAKIDK